MYRLALNMLIHRAGNWVFVSWGKSHNVGSSEEENRGRKGTKSIMGKRTIFCVFSLLFSVFFARVGLAELLAPNWMSGFPLLAGNQVIMMWTPVPGASKYVIYLNGEKVGESAAFQYTMPAPEKSGDYKVTVAGLDGAGKQGKLSGIGLFKIISLEPPSGVIAMVSQDSIGLRWDQTTGAMIYNVFRAESETGEKNLIGSTQDTTFRDTKAQKEKRYFYFITAKDVSGKESGHSKPVPAKLEVAAELAKAETATLLPVRTEYEIFKLIRPSQSLISPSDLVFYKGNLYLVDNAHKKVFIFNTDVEMVGQFGEEGYLDGQFVSPRGISIHEGVIAVSDQSREVVMLFSADPGNAFLREFPIPKKEEKDKPPVPAYLAFTPKGTLVVVDGPNFRLVELDKNGKSLRYYGIRNITPFFKLGEFASLSFLRIDKDGRIFVVDKAYGKIHVLDGDFKPLFAIGLDKGVGSFIDGGKVAFDYTNGVVFVSDPMLATIQAFGMGDGKYRFSLFDSEKSIQTEYVPKWGIGSPRVLEMDDAGHLWVIMGLNREIAKFTKFLDPLPGESRK